MLHAPEMFLKIIEVFTFCLTFMTFLRIKILVYFVFMFTQGGFLENEKERWYIKFLNLLSSVFWLRNLATFATLLFMSVKNGAVFLYLCSKILYQNKVDKRFRNSVHHPVYRKQKN